VGPPEPRHACSARRFQGIPGIERAANGRMWAAWYGGGAGEEQMNVVMLATAPDAGGPWTPPVLVIDPDGDGPVRAFDPCLWHDPAGKLWLFWAQGSADHKTSPTWGVWAMTTEDSGSESPAWSAPLRLCDGILMNKPTVLASAVLAEPGATALTLLREADIAVAEARAGGGQAVRVFTPDMVAHAGRRSAFEDELRFALDAEEFELAYQPVVTMCDRRTVAAEGLLRWRHPREGLIAPDDFLRVAEESQLIRPMGRVALGMACAALAALPPHAMQIGVNASSVELSDDRWVDGILTVIEDSGVDPCCLVIEVSETAVQSAHRSLEADLMRLRKRGVGIFLDNFGSGISSLAMLRDLPLSGVKLDSGVVASLVRPHGFGAALAKGVLEVIRPLGLAGVATGVETEEQAAGLIEMGWEFGQGFLFGRPGSLNSVSPVPVRLLGALPH
jgi:EAL domain-containing protein (putative c-di-GMP-specific phosphodiesterase class I)